MTSFMFRAGLSPSRQAYEPNISCLLLHPSSKKPVFLLLFVRHNNVIEPVFLDKVGRSEHNSPLPLLCFSLLKGANYPDDTLLSIRPKSAVGGKLLDVLFPEHHPDLLRVGVLEGDLI